MTYQTYVVFDEERTYDTRFSQRTRYLNAVNTLKELLSMGVVPIVNENDTVSVSVSTSCFCFASPDSVVTLGNKIW